MTKRYEALVTDFNARPPSDHVALPTENLFLSRDNLAASSSTHPVNALGDAAWMGG